MKLIHWKRLPAACLDLLLAAASFYTALLLRFDFTVDPEYTAILPAGLAVLLIVRGSVFYFHGLYRGMGKYAGMGELMLIIRAVTAGSILYITLQYIFGLRFPRSVLIVDWFLTVFSLGAAHFSQRILQDYFRRRPADSARVLIYGAGDAGDMVVREIRKNRRLPYVIRGFIDDDPEKLHRRINRITVLGSRENLGDIISAEGISEIIIAIPSASGEEFRTVFETASRFPVKISTIPDLKDILDKRYSLTDIRDVRLEDLIRRKPVELYSGNAHEYLQGKTILVTGAAGSIGSELCRQLADFNPDRLVMLDRDENRMFYLEQSLRSHPRRDAFRFRLFDLNNLNKLENVFRRDNPGVVFHSAAYKHVPVMEKNPDEAVENNVRNSIELARLAGKYSVEKFVNVSTDKAVYPVNIMGATKRIVELFLQARSRGSRTKFMTVRFGNVIGSRGSVVPIFKEQIQKGGPVTVTDPAMERFFMTIPEAVSLINQACALGEGGEIFILNMGEPVKIIDLARDLIKLSGFREGRDIDIVFSGIRPGEKIREELWFREESPQPTHHDKILRAQQMPAFDYRELNRMIDTLLSHSGKGDAQSVLKVIREILPDFQPAHGVVH